VGVDAWRGKEAKKYKEQYNNIFLTESCYRSRDREIAQNLTSAGTEGLIACGRIATCIIIVYLSQQRYRRVDQKVSHKEEDTRGNCCEADE
jgi:hypothetical protein